MPGTSDPWAIKSVSALEILDSRGNPTVEVSVMTSNGQSFTAAVPSGASTGIYEALELRDKDKSRYLGKGVLKAIKNVESVIGPALIGKSVADQSAIDRLMVESLDGSQNEWGFSKSKLGANAILGVSMAVCCAGAAANGLKLYEYIRKLLTQTQDRVKAQEGVKADSPKVKPAGTGTSSPVGDKGIHASVPASAVPGSASSNYSLPLPSFNVINGGAHAGNALACQEFMISPIGAANFADGLRMAAEVYHNLKSLVAKKYGQDACNVGDEGGFAIPVKSNEEALEVLAEAIKAAGFDEKTVRIGTDVAASEFYMEDVKKYDLGKKIPDSVKATLPGGAEKLRLTAQELAGVYANWMEKYHLISVEDPFDQDDWEAYESFFAKFGAKVEIVGDDLLVTNVRRMQKAVERKAVNALLLKINQIGSVSEAIEAFAFAKAHGWKVMVSHRSGETEDTFIADLAVGLGADQIKSGAPCRGERTAKYNRLLRIEKELGPRAVYQGKQWK